MKQLRLNRYSWYRFIRKDIPEGWDEIDSTLIDELGKVDEPRNPYSENEKNSPKQNSIEEEFSETIVNFQPVLKKKETS